MAFTDPPYNLPIQGHVSGLGATRHREFEMASGEMSSSAFTSFLEQPFRHMAAFSQDGSVHDICIDWRHLPEMLTAGKAVFSELLNLCVWNKDNGGMGSLYRSKHEIVAIWKAGRGPHINNVQLGPTWPLPHQCLGTTGASTASAANGTRRLRCIRP